MSDQAIRFLLDGHPAEAMPGDTVIQAARRAGKDIPSMCFREGLAPRTSCFLCVVRVEGRETLQPSCALPVTEGMRVTTTSEEIQTARRTALELLLSDHAGRCVAPCAMACSAHLDIPAFTRLAARGEFREAVRQVRRHLAMPACLGRICHCFCKNPCLRNNVDEAIGVKALHGWLAERDLATGDPALPDKAPPTGRRVAIVGGGPAGLFAAWFLLMDGHEPVVLEAADRPGGRLRDFEPEKLDQSILDAEVDVVRQFGARIECGCALGRDCSLEELRADYDAVLLATGAWAGPTPEEREVDRDFVKRLGFKFRGRGIDVDRGTLATEAPGVFAAGELVSGSSWMVRASALGMRAAASISQHVAAGAVTGPAKPYYFRAREIAEEDARFYARAAPGPQPPPTPDGFDAASAIAEAFRCMQCSCGARDDCLLRRWSAEYDAQANRFGGVRRQSDPDDAHPGVHFDPGKCILCGLCVATAAAAGEGEGLAFHGRGFEEMIASPLGRRFAEASPELAGRCADACPTGALTRKS